MATRSHADHAAPLLTVYERPRGVHPPLACPAYRSTRLRAPTQPLVLLPHRLTELTGPVLGAERVPPGDSDLTRQHEGEPVGQRIVVRGRVLDSDGRCVPDTLVEIWQANAWRPAHIHFSIFGRAFTQRLVTQMYFPDDPLFAHDPIFNSVPEAARSRLVSRFDIGTTRAEWALCFVFDLVLRGAGATPFEQAQEEV